MITENLHSLKIHDLTQEQYERELNAGHVDRNAIYLTPDEEITPEKIGAAPLIGIGTYIGDIDDLDTLPINSVVWTTPDTVNTPFDGYGLVETQGSSHRVRKQIYTSSTMCVAERLYINYNWTEWDWKNPPMKVDMEYRTAERVGGEVVYAKRVSYKSDTAIGSTTSYTDTEIPHGISNLKLLVRCNCIKGTISLPYLDVDGGFTTIEKVTSDNIVLRNYKKTWSAATWYFDLWYIKKPEE